MKNIVESWELRTEQIKLLGLCVCVVLSTQILSAQSGSVGNDEVIIVTAHDAKIKDADKISTSPSIPQLEDPKVNFDYSIPSRDFKDIHIDPNPLKPIALSKEKKERFNSSYVKLGFGSQLSPLAEIIYNGKSKIWHYGIDASHMSAFPFDIKNQRFHDTKAGAYLRVYPATYLVGADFRFLNYITHFYGLQNAETQTMKQIRQTFQDFDGKVQFASAKKNKAGLDFNSGVQFDYFRELAGKSNEFFIHGNVALSKTFAKYHTVGGGFDFDVSKYTSSIQNLWRQYYLIKLHYGFNNKDWLARGAFTFGLEGVNKTTTFYPLPDLYLQKKLYKKYLYAYAGWEISYLKNSFRNYALENNFIQSNIQLQNTRISDVNIGLNGTVSGFSYKAQFSYKYVWNQAFFLTAPDERRFFVYNSPNMIALNPHLELGYNYRDDFTALLRLDYNKYTVSDFSTAWYMPDFTANLKLRYNIKDKIIVGADVYGFTTYYGLDGDLTRGLSYTQQGTADANLSLEYLFNKHFSFFGYLNNIAHQKYQRWANYPVFGINGLVGAKYSF